MFYVSFFSFFPERTFVVVLSPYPPCACSLSISSWFRFCINRLVMHIPPKKKKKSILGTNPRLEAPLPPFFLRTIFRNSAITPDSPHPKVHHPAIDSLVLSLQCGKAAAVFVPSRCRDFVAEVGKCGSRSLDLLFLVLWPSVSFTASPSMSSTRTYEYFSKNLLRCNVIFLALQL